jgi:hypothetical protein
MKQKVVIGCIVLVLGVLAPLMVLSSSKAHAVEEDMERISLRDKMDEFLEERGWRRGYDRRGRKQHFIVLSERSISLPPSHPYYEGARFLAYKEAVARVRSDLAKMFGNIIHHSEEGRVEKFGEVTEGSRFGEMEMLFDLLEDDNTQLKSVTKREMPRMVAEPYMTYLFETEKEVGVIAIWSQEAADQIESGRPVTITFKNVRTEDDRAVVESVVDMINYWGERKGFALPSDAELVGENKIKCTLRGTNKWFLDILRGKIPDFPLAITVGENNILATF